MQRVYQLLLTAACLSLPAGAFAQQTDAATSASPGRGADNVAAPDVAAQPVVQGQLANGLRYAILPRRGAESGVALRFRVNGGFLAEQRPGTRGLAHLIEHLIFHSPTQTAPDQVRRFREVGFPLTLPDPAGGTTTWRESDYFVVSRTTQPADLDALLGLFREVLSGLTLRPDIVDGQRAEVMREMAERQLGNDLYAGYIAAIAPGSPTDVINAQNSDDVPTASVETVRALYQRLYRPENITVTIVGDVDPQAMAALIERRYGDWQGVGPAPSRQIVPSFDRSRIAPTSYSDHPYGRNVAMVTLTMPFAPPPRTRADQAEAMLMDMVATRAVNNRLGRTRADYPYGKYGMYIENGDQGHRTFIMWDDFVPGRWRAAVADLSAMTCSLRSTGFSDEDWAAAMQQVLEELMRRANTMAGEPNFAVAMQLTNAVTDGRAFISSAELLGIAQSWLPTVPAGQGSDWWRSQWRVGTPHLRVEAPELARLDDAGALIRATVDTAQREMGCNPAAR
jgi:predicted Zn-dependent peptidase